jgi:hypothetical protein
VSVSVKVTPKAPNKVFTPDEWLDEGERRFGKDRNSWRFVCPCCKHVASVADWKAAGASQGEIGFSCIGRRMTSARDAFGSGPGPCDYAGGGLFQLNPITIADGDVKTTRFAFAEVSP